MDDDYLFNKLKQDKSIYQFLKIEQKRQLRFIDEAICELFIFYLDEYINKDEIADEELFKNLITVIVRRKISFHHLQIYHMIENNELLQEQLKIAFGKYDLKEFKEKSYSKTTINKIFYLLCEKILKEKYQLSKEELKK